MRKLTAPLLALFFPLALLGQLEKAQPLSGNVNSGYNEWAPLLSPGGEKLYFARFGHPQNMGNTDESDLWTAIRDEQGQWAHAVNAGAPLNSRQAEYAVGIHASGRRLYLLQLPSNTLAYSERQGRAWSEPEPMMVDSFRLPEGKVFAHVSFDGQVLLLSAAGPDSRGGTDVYISFARSARRFGRPRNLGPVINSPFDEQSPFLAADGKTLYFSSARPGGFGGQDLYMCRRLDDSWANWSAPVSLGAAINTNANERFLTLPASGQPACFLRDNLEGFTDIFEAALPDSLLPEPVALVSGKVKDARTGAPLEAEVQLQPFLASGGFQNGLQPTQESRFQFIIPLEEDASLLALREGYFPVSQPLELSGHALEELDQEQPGLLAATGKDMEYLQRNEEIERLQRQLRRLDDELIALRQEWEAARPAIAGQREQNPGHESLSGSEPDALRHRYKTYPQARPDTLGPESPQPHSPQEGAGLQAVKERYERHARRQKELLAELNQLLQLQIEQEKRRAAQSAVSSEEVVAPLQPPAKPLRKYREMRKELLLAPAEPGQSIPLNTLIFEPNSPALKPLAYAELARVVDFLKQNEHLVVELGVHAAGKLSHSTALSLTTQRAQAIANYLAGHGISAGRVVPKGYGKAFPIADNRTEEGQRLNQRVELRIIGTE